MRHVSYSSGGLAPTGQLVSAMRSGMKGIRYDTMVGTGISGALVVPAVGRAMRKRWALIRKHGVSSHAEDVHYEGVIGDAFIIVDDWVSTGATVGNILGSLMEACGSRRPVFMGVWQYNPERFMTPSSLLLAPHVRRYENAPRGRS